MSATRSSLLTPNISPLGQDRWKPFITNEELSSYSFYLPNSNNADYDDEDNKTTADTATLSPSQLDQWFRKLHPSNYEYEPARYAWTDATYKNQLLLRKTAWHTFDDECTCEYGYSDTWQPLIRSEKMKAVLQEITAAVSAVVGLNGTEELNSVNLNYYPRGGGVGFHADDEFLFDGLKRETRIISLSLCSVKNNSGDSNKNDNFGARIFQVKRKAKKYESDVSEITLCHGDLMTMEGMFQKYYLHSVWPGDNKKFMDHEMCQGERINLTWRTIVRHLDGSAECRGHTCPLSQARTTEKS